MTRPDDEAPPAERDVEHDERADADEDQRTDEYEHHDEHDDEDDENAAVPDDEHDRAIDTDNPHARCVLALESVYEATLDLDALNGNLAVLLDGLPADPAELARERDPIDLERLARQARVASRVASALRDKLEDAIDDVRMLARRAAETTVETSSGAPSP